MADFKELVRIASTDIPGKKSVYLGLTQIHGINYSFSHALCHVLHLEKRRKIGSLNEKEVKDIEATLNNPEQIPAWLRNRKKNADTGNDQHMLGASLKLAKEFDIRRLKKIRSYRGIRHAMGLPLRGQRTRSHFRHGKAVGVMKKTVKAAMAKAEAGKKQEGKK